MKQAAPRAWKRPLTAFFKGNRKLCTARDCRVLCAGDEYETREADEEREADGLDVAQRAHEGCVCGRQPRENMRVASNT